MESVALKELRLKTLRFMRRLIGKDGDKGEKHSSFCVLVMKAWLGLGRYGGTEKDLKGRCNISTRAAIRVVQRVVGDCVNGEGSRVRVKLKKHSDSDLHMMALALELCCTLMSDRRSGPTVGLTVRNKVLPQALALVKISLLQGQALLVLINLCIGQSLLSTAKPSPQSGGIAKQALFSIAQCVAVLCLAAGDHKCSSAVKMLREILKVDSNTNSAKQHLALLCLGEIGRRKDLSSWRWHEIGSSLLTFSLQLFLQVDIGVHSLIFGFPRLVIVQEK
ncbi:cullin-associated NEDD8-dissociated protein 1 [Tanacetum coccineum]